MENFDVEVAMDLLPVLDDTEESLYQLINAIQFYEPLLDDEGKKTLCLFVLKINLPIRMQSQLEKNYESCESLINAIKRCCFVQRDVGSLSMQLHTARQGVQSISEFGILVEKLLFSLTRAQAGEDEKLERFLYKINEEIAIHVFVNGLRKYRLRIIMKCQKLEGSYSTSYR